MKKLRTFPLFLTFMLTLLTACNGGMGLKTLDVRDSGQITGTYSLILFHDESFDGLKTIAFLDVEGDGFTLLPNAPAYEYTVTPNIDGQEALRKARAFIRSSPIYIDSEISSILAPSGKIIGYEVRPLYGPLNYGVSDVMTVSYFPKSDGTVKINIDLLEMVIQKILSRP